MRRSTRIVKKVLALFLVVLMSINTFGAVVGDNDGAAFITKAEFDSLKNDFQSQIDQYNTSIDAKIDGAISSYLSGINVAKKTQIILNGELNDVDLGKGYRAYNVTDMNVDWKDEAEWIINQQVYAATMGYWEDLDRGIVSFPRSAQDKSSSLVKLVPAGGADAYWHRYYDDGTEHWDNLKTMGLDAYRFSPLCVVTTMTGTIAPYRSTRPIVFCNMNGIIDDFSNKRVTVLDNRVYRSKTWPSGRYRGSVLIGKNLEKPTYAVYNFNENVLVESWGGAFDNIANYYQYFTKTSTPLRVLIKAATAIYNPNIFCWNLANDTTIEAKAARCEKWYVNGAVTNPALSEYNSNLNTTYTVTGPTWPNLDFINSAVSRPQVKFESLSNYTNLSDSCFKSVSTDSQKYLYMKNLKNPTFIGSDKTTNTYVYQGLPVFYAQADGTLEFKIKIKTNYDSSTFFFTDPGTASSKIKLRIKSSEFNIGTDTTGAVSMKVGTSSSPITSGTTAVTEATLTPDELTTIQIENCERGKTYFLRWYVDGFQYGGEITYLGDGYFTET